MFSGLLSTKHTLNAFGTHQRITKNAYLALLKIKPNLVYVPTLEEVLHYEGHLGPDQLWLESAYHGDEHKFHPLTGEGGCMQCIKKSFAELVKSYCKKEQNHAEISKNLAHLAHYIADVYCPPHIEVVEHKKETRRLSKKDLFMRSILIFVHKKTRKKYEQIYKEILFETRLVWQTVFRKMKLASINEEDVLGIDVIANDIEAYLTAKICETYNKELFKRYVKEGWTKEIAREVRDFILPEAASTIAITWLAAIHTAEQHKCKAK